MLNTKFFIFLMVVTIHSVFAGNAAFAESEIAGSLPYSTQWISERTSSYLYVGLNYGQMNSQFLMVDSYQADFGSQGFAYPSIDFFSQILSFAGAESRSSLKDWALWGRYSLGTALRSAQLSSTQTPIDGSVAHDSLLFLSVRLGAMVGYDHWSWVKPFAGLELDPYAYRNTSGISGAEQQGGAFTFGPVVGMHFPLFFGG